MFICVIMCLMKANNNIDKENEMKKISRMLDSENINAMVKALRQAKVFTIERTKETIIITHPKAGEVLRSLRNKAVWITRYNKNLFA